jgi:hypothetical protein
MEGYYQMTLPIYCWQCAHDSALRRRPRGHRLDCRLLSFADYLFLGYDPDHVGHWNTFHRDKQDLQNAGDVVVSGWRHPFHLSGILQLLANYVDPVSWARGGHHFAETRLLYPPSTECHVNAKACRMVRWQIC